MGWNGNQAGPFRGQSHPSTLRPDCPVVNVYRPPNPGGTVGKGRVSTKITFDRPASPVILVLPPMHSTDRQRLSHFVSRLGPAPACAVFDIGSRGIRLLVAPAGVPADWRKDTFCLIGEIANLGQAVTAEGVLPVGSPEFRKAERFLAFWVRRLGEERVSDLSIIATAWFRRVANPGEIRSAVEQATGGHRLELVSQPREAHIGLLAVPEVLGRWRGLRPAPEIADEDRILMIDQGGGSLEISWMRWGDRHLAEPGFHAARFPDLGTVALRQRFLQTHPGLSPAGPFPLQPIRDVVSAALNARSKYFPVAGQTRWHVFATGSAITSVRKGNIHDKHGRRVSLEQMEALLAKSAASLPDPAKADTHLTRIFGIPVYQETLKRLGLGDLMLFGYGLGFGYYLWTRKQPPPLPPFPPEDGVDFAFISHARPGDAEVHDELYTLDSLDIRFWWDKATHPDALPAASTARLVERCSAMIIFLTPEAGRSPLVRDEVILARELQKPLIPVVLRDPGPDLEPGLRAALAPIPWILRHSMPQDAYESALLDRIPAACRKPRP